MVRATFYGLELGKSGLAISQKGLDVTGHNIANVDTAGYTRQRLVNAAAETYGGVQRLQPIMIGTVGRGAQVQVLDQLRSGFLDRQFRSEQTAYSNWATRTQGLSYVEALFESADGEATLNSTLSGLFSAFNTVSGESADSQQRTYLKQQAIKTTEQFNHMYRALIDLQSDQNKAVETVVSQVNNIAGQIAALNNSIYFAEVDGQPANDLRDKRGLLVDQLSALVDISYTGEAIGAKFEIKVAGKALVSHTETLGLTIHKEANLLGPASEGFEERSVIYWETSPLPGNQEALNLGALNGGELLAHINLRDGVAESNAGIPYFVNQLNSLAQSLVQSVNAQHRQGYTHPAGGTPSHQGVNFFQEEPGSPIYADPSDPTSAIIGYDVSKVTAGNIRISDDIEQSVYNIAASSARIVLDDSNQGALQTGNNSNSRAIFNLSFQQDLQLLAADGTARGVGSFNGQITSMVIDVATILEHSKTVTDNCSTLMLSADTQRTSVSGVSMDEEMTNLIRYNHAYSGASRVITAMDEALDLLINRMGLVGRG